MSSFSNYIQNKNTQPKQSSFANFVSQQRTVEKKKGGLMNIVNKVGKFVSDTLYGGAKKLGTTLGEAAFTATPEYKEVINRISKGQMTQEDLYQIAPSLKKSTAQVLGEAGETVLDIATLGTAGTVAKSAGKVALKTLAKQGAKTGLKLGAGYGLTGGLQKEGATATSVLGSTALGAGVGTGIGMVAEPLANVVGRVLKSTFKKSVKESTQEVSEVITKKYTNVSDKPLQIISPTKKIITNEVNPVRLKRGDTIFSRGVGARFEVVDVEKTSTGKVLNLNPKITLKSSDGGLIKVDGKDLTNFKSINERVNYFPEIKQEKPEEIINEVITKKELYKNTQRPYLQKLKTALEDAKVTSKAQEKIRSTERSQKLGAYSDKIKTATTEKELYAAKSQLRGEQTKLTFESLRGKLSQLDIDAISRDIAQSPALTGYERVNATDAFSKMMSGEVAADSERVALAKIVGDDVIKVLEKKQPLLQRLASEGYDIANIPRSVMSSFDFSASFRQSLVAAVRHPVIFAQNFPKQFKYFASEKAFQESLGSIRRRPSFSIMTDKQLGNVSILDMGDITKREERFFSGWVEKLTGGKYSPIRASGRAYTGFLNQMRADTFDSLVNNYIKGTEQKPSDKLVQQIGRLVNASTGRGELIGVLKPHAELLNTVFFSPRLIASRMHFFNPLNYIKAEPFVRKEYLKTLGAMGVYATTILGMATATGADVSFDPRSSDFLKVKVGNTRIDILGGFGQYLVLGGRLITGETKSTTTGRVRELGGAFGQQSYGDAIGRFFETKEAPLPAFISTLINQKPIFDNQNLGSEIVKQLGGKVRKDKINVASEITNRFIPMIAQDAYDIYKEYGIEMTPLSILAILGIGLQTYK